MIHGQPWHRWRELLAGRRMPAAIVDLDAVDHNLDALLQACAPGITIRLASKSIRVPAVLRHLVARGGARVRGLMTYHVGEAAYLAGQPGGSGAFGDLLMGYPVACGGDLDALVRAPELIAMLDSTEHVAALSEALKRREISPDGRETDAGADSPVRVCIDVDVSLRPAPGVHLGVRRSPIRDAEQALQVARAVRDAPGLELVAVMAYEAQVAGLPDRVPGERVLDPVRRLIKSRSRKLAADRRKAVVQALRQDGFDVTIINGGGTGSVASTSHDGSVTEVTAGSGFFCPTLFDGYDDLALLPAAFFALPVVRRSDPDHVTCGFGGFIASGPTGGERAPTIHAPAGLSTLGMEGFGEVQTPLRVSGDLDLRLGDPVICRHAKAGELMTRFHRVLLVRDGAVVDEVAPYPAFF